MSEIKTVTVKVTQGILDMVKAQVKEIKKTKIGYTQSDFFREAVEDKLRES